MVKIISKEGDMIDAIICAYFQTSSPGPRTTARVLAANPELCLQPARLPAGVGIFLPDDLNETADDGSVKLWD